MLLRCISIAARAAGSLLSPSPNKRSKTRRGLYSIGSGVVGVRQETVLVYAQLYPESHPPPSVGLSVHTSSEATWFCPPRCFAAIWSTEIPQRIPTPSVFFGWTPVGQTAASRA